ncbi:MAG: GIY-YIG nuclease family protein [Bacteroidota bacterium]|nr:GIY-YIG nuclease family protein [Bacteroidota bacterium]
MLYSRSKSRYYIGHTKDLRRRLFEHNNGYSKWSRSGIPWEVVYHIEFRTKAEAILLENKIKRRGAGRYLKELT